LRRVATQSEGTPTPDPAAGNTAGGGKKRLASRVLDVVLGGAFGFVLFRFGAYVLEWPDACQHITAQAEKHDSIRDRVGLPLKASLMWSGSVHDTSAIVSIPISGPVGSAKLEARCARNSTSHPWTLIVFQIVFPDSPQKYDILLPEMNRRTVAR
jgi:hypothetical protein